MNDRKNFVAPGPPRPLRPAEIMPAQPPTVDLAAAWQPMSSPGRDSVSAMDRARAFHVRSAPAYVAVIGMAITAVVLYSATLWLLRADGAPWMADRILIFLAIVFGGGMAVFVQLNRTDYDHSHAGIERLRITEAADIQREIVQADLEIRREALRAYVHMLEDHNMLEDRNDR